MEEKQDYLSSVFQPQETLLSYKINSINSFTSSKTFIEGLNDSSDTLELSQFTMKNFLLPIYQSNKIPLRTYSTAKTRKIRHPSFQKQQSTQNIDRKKTNKKRNTQQMPKKYRFLKVINNSCSHHSLIFEQFVIASSEINGQGYLILQDGRIIEGEFTCGYPLGTISIKFPNGLYYKGSVYEFRPHGYGQIYLPNGSRFIGQFSYGQPHGQGIHYAKNGTIKRQGQWRHGKFINQYVLIILHTNIFYSKKDKKYQKEKGIQINLQIFLVLSIRTSLELQNKMSDSYDALIYLSLNKIKRETDQQLKEFQMILTLRKGKDVKDRKEVGRIENSFKNKQQPCDLSKGFICIAQKQDVLEVQLVGKMGKTNGFIRFPLEKLIQMPRVRHEIQCMLVEKNWDRFFEGPLKNLAQLQLSLVCFDRILGKMIVTGLEISLQRNTQAVGEMDPYVVLKLQQQTQQTDVRNNAGKHCVWSTKMQFQISTFKKGLTLQLAVMDQDNITSDIVGSCNIDLVEMNMIIPYFEKKKSNIFELTYEKQRAGTIKIEYNFIAAPFNF